MPTELEPIEMGTITPVRRIRSITIQTYRDTSVASGPAQEKITATYEYEIAYPDEEGGDVIPPKHDGYVTLDDAQCRANPSFMSGLAAISSVGDAAKEEQTPAPVPA